MNESEIPLYLMRDQGTRCNDYDDELREIVSDMLERLSDWEEGGRTIIVTHRYRFHTAHIGLQGLDTADRRQTAHHREVSGEGWRFREVLG